jgi:hypothetical protein
VPVTRQSAPGYTPEHAEVSQAALTDMLTDITSISPHALASPETMDPIPA